MKSRKEKLKLFNWKLKLPPMAPKTILAAVLLSIIASLPVLGNFLPEQVDYKTEMEEVILKPVINKIGDAIIILSQSGKILICQKNKASDQKSIPGL